jgi:hypothetical protein
MAPRENMSRSTILAISSTAVISFLLGSLTVYFGIFPYPHIRDAMRTLEALLTSRSLSKQLIITKVDNLGTIALDSRQDLLKARWKQIDASANPQPVIAVGGSQQYLDYCPDTGCLAVAFDRQRRVEKAWPYRPTEIFASDLTGGAYRHEMVSFSPELNVLPIDIEPYEDDDLLVTFHARGRYIFPFAMGLARVGPDGTPRWSRFDYSHHWFLLGSNGLAYVPSLRIGEESLRVTLGSPKFSVDLVLECETDRPQLDIVQVIDGEGKLVDEFDVNEILLTSNYSGLALETTDHCDPLHLNFVDVIGAGSGGGLEPGDLVLSLRNLSRFVILDPRTKRIKRVAAGGFIQQHSVRHLSGSKFLVFDNRGGDSDGPPSRIIEHDLLNGAERVIFPNTYTPSEYAHVFTDTGGYIDISPDRKRILASFTFVGRAFEIDIESGRLLAVFDNIQDVSQVPDLPQSFEDAGVRMPIYGLKYY